MLLLQCNRKRKWNTRDKFPQLKALLHQCESTWVLPLKKKRLKSTRQKLPIKKSICSCSDFATFSQSIYLSIHLSQSIQFVRIKCQLHWVKYSAGEPKNKEFGLVALAFEFTSRKCGPFKYTSPLHSIPLVARLYFKREKGKPLTYFWFGWRKRKKKFFLPFFYICYYKIWHL